MKKIQLLPAIFMAAVSSAHATELKPYISVYGGADFGSKNDIYGHNPAGMVRDIDVKYKDAFIYGMAVGASIWQGRGGSVNLELEYTRRDLETESLSLNAVGRDLNGSRANSLNIDAWMANIIFETPYFFDRMKYSMGAGVGQARMKYDVNYLVNNATPQTQINIKSTTDPLAYQFMAGLVYDVTDNVAAYSNVKYFAVKHHDVNRYKLNNGAGLESVLDSSFDSSWSVDLGLRYTF